MPNARAQDLPPESCGWRVRDWNNSETSHWLVILMVNLGLKLMVNLGLKLMVNLWLILMVNLWLILMVNLWLILMVNING